jgi:hypothetical protein
MELASEADRQLSAQRRQLLRDQPPPPTAGIVRTRITAAMARLSDRWRNRSGTPRTRQTMEPSGS